MSTNRRLAALMFTDMVGYSALARDDEQMAREMVDAQRVIIRDALKRHQGREHQTTGDGFFLEFGSAVNAVQCAVEIQTAMHERERYLPENRRIKIRIGIHLGDILTNDEDLFGNGVNVAARVEPLAKPGGICITRQIHDQVFERISGTSFKKDGRKNLKNIRGGAEIFHVVLPWENETTKTTGENVGRLRKYFAFHSVAQTLNSSLVTLLTGACALSLVVASGGAIRSALQNEPVSARNPAQALATEPVDLSKGWSFRTAPDSPWEKFETHESWKHAEKLRGSYSMTKSFRTNGDIKEPAIVLGLITDTHRAFLNGKFIGGSNRSGELTFYSFDPALLLPNEENTLLIEGETRPALNPGLIVIPKVGAFLGEFSKVREKVHANEISFHFLRNMYFGLSLLIFAAAFLFSMFRKSSMPYLYSSIILLLSSLNLAYYSPWISSSFEYPFLRFLKVIALTHIPLVLVSAQLRLLRRTKAEAWNNAFSLIALLVIAFVLLGVDVPSATFIGNYNTALIAAAGYAFVATLWMTTTIAKEFRRSTSVTIRGFHVMYLALTLLSFVSAFGSVKSGPDAISLFVQSVTTAELRFQVTEFGISLPFIFSLFLVGVATFDYIQQSRSARRKRRRDSMMLELVRLMTSMKPFGEIIAALQTEMCSYLEADRSTLYVLDVNDSNEALTADYIHTTGSANLDVKRQISSKEGVIGYVLANQTPLLIPDIRRDRRFFGPDAQYPVQGFDSYKTGSCMLFPLLSQGRLVGVMTFADKRGGSKFEAQDFATSLELSSTLALLLDNQEMRRALAG